MDDSSGNEVSFISDKAKYLVVFIKNNPIVLTKSQIAIKKTEKADKLKEMRQKIFSSCGNRPIFLKQHERSFWGPLG